MFQQNITIPGRVLRQSNIIFYNRFNRIRLRAFYTHRNITGGAPPFMRRYSLRYRFFTALEKEKGFRSARIIKIKRLDDGCITIIKRI